MEISECKIIIIKYNRFYEYLMDLMYKDTSIEPLRKGKL